MKKRRPSLILEKNQRLDLMKAALGEVKSDLLIRDGNLLNVYTGEILEKWSVSILKSRIAYVGNEPDHTIGEHTHVLDASGKTIIPGLIDGHAHLAWLFNTSEFLKSAVKGGTTAIITETMEPYPVSGVDGVLELLDSFEGQPIKIFATAPAMGSISKNLRGIRLSALKKLMLHPAVLGLGEAYWQGVFQNPKSILPAIQETLKSNKILEGHSAGARGKKLAAYAALGFSSCHEPVAVEEVLERLRLGIWVMIREGSIRRDLEAVSRIKDIGIDFRRAILVTDGITPKDLMEKGYMEYVVQKAINCGIDPVSA
ncbi:MAG: amidohydrolase family protein, partial [Thermodesulfobacteriota bacterium]